MVCTVYTLYSMCCVLLEPVTEVYTVQGRQGMEKITITARELWPPS